MQVESYFGRQSPMCDSGLSMQLEWTIDERNLSFYRIIGEANFWNGLKKVRYK